MVFLLKDAIGFERFGIMFTFVELPLSRRNVLYYAPLLRRSIPHVMDYLIPSCVNITFVND